MVFTTNKQQAICTANTTRMIRSLSKIYIYVTNIGQI